MPGITAAFSVPALAGIPVTQRGVATSVHVSSGHVGADAASLAALAAGATVVYLMAVSALPDICAAALAAGVAADLPVAMVEQGSTARERVTRATMATAGCGGRARGGAPAGDRGHGAGRCSGLPRRPGVCHDGGVGR